MARTSGRKTRSSDSVSRLARLAQKRNRKDLREGHKRGLWFDREAAEHAVQGFRQMVLWEGPKAGTCFYDALQPWQTEDIIRPLMGWKRLPKGMTARDARKIPFRKEIRSGLYTCPRVEAGIYRRFQNAWIELPRKNAKTTLGCGIGYYLGAMDLEHGAQIVCAATKREQAAKLLRILKRMPGPALKKRLDIQKYRITVPGLDTLIETISSDASTEAGGNTHGALVDEMGDHKTRDLLSVVETGTVSRLQSLVMGITSSGPKPSGTGWDEHCAAVSVLNGLVENDSFFAYITHAEPAEDPGDPRVWRRANPNFGISVYEHKLRDAWKRAQMNPAFLNPFKRFHLNLWVGAAEAWMDPERWRRLADPGFDWDGMAGRPCFAGFDLSLSQDLTALCLLFPPAGDDTYWRIQTKFYCPQETIDRRAVTDRVDYGVWVRQGWVTPTPGWVVDYGFLQKDLMEADEKYNLMFVGYDPANAPRFSRDLQDVGFEERMTIVRQGHITLNAPTKEFERMILDARIRHDGNPVFAWNLANVVLNTDRNVNYLPDKAKSADRIDGVSAAMGALSVFMGEEEEAYAFHAI